MKSIPDSIALFILMSPLIAIAVIGLKNVVRDASRARRRRSI